MMISKEELISQIETARENLNNSIDREESGELIYQNSINLDHLIEQYIVEGY